MLLCVFSMVLKTIRIYFDLSIYFFLIKKAGFADDYKKFTAMLNNVDSVLILGDSSGQIVFDKLLVEELVSMNIVQA